MKFILISIFISFLNVSYGKTFYYHTIRQHMMGVFKNLGARSGYQAIGVKEKDFDQIIKILKEGDIFFCDLESVYSISEGLSSSATKFFRKANQKKAKIYLQFHKTTTESFPHLVNDVHKVILKNNIYPIVMLKEQLSFINSKYLELNPLFMPNPESMIINFDADMRALKLKSGVKRILFIEQCNEEGAIALRKFVEAFETSNHRGQLIISLHPSSINNYEDLINRYTFFKSGPDLKTLDLLPHVDGVVTVASTMKEIAERYQIPTFSPQKLAKLEFSYDGFSSFFGELEIEKRSSRVRIISDFVGSITRHWTELLRGENCVHILRKFGPSF